MLKGVLRLGSELPLQSTMGVFGVQDGELGTDVPRGSGCRDEPENIEEHLDHTTDFLNINTQIINERRLLLTMSVCHFFMQTHTR